MAVFLFLLPGEGLSQVVIVSKYLKGDLPQGPESPLWDKGQSVNIPMAGQIVAPPRLYKPGVMDLVVKSLHNDEEVAFLLQWEDKTKDGGTVIEGKAYSDAIALQFPVELYAGNVKPSFIMGEPGKAVNIWYWKANGEVAEMNAEGPELIYPQKGLDVKGKGEWKEGIWKVYLSRKLKNEDAKDTQFPTEGFIPIAFAVWEGSNREKGAQSSITTWHYVKLSKPPGLTVYAAPILATVVAGLIEIYAVRWARRKRQQRVH